MGQLLDILTAPGALASLRWQWLLDSPVAPTTEADIPDLTGAFPAVEALDVSLDTSGMGIGGGIAILTATVPTPPGWPGVGKDTPLGGLALILPEQQLAHLCWLSPPVRPMLRSVVVTLEIHGGQ